VELVSELVPPIPLEELAPGLAPLFWLRMVGFELVPELDPEGELDPPIPLLKEITAKSILPEEGFTIMS